MESGGPTGSAILPRDDGSPQSAGGGGLINGVHVILHSRDAAADRAFFRDTLGLPDVDAGSGWLIFKLPPAEVALHPADAEAHHEPYLMCDDLEETLAELAGTGVEVTHTIDRQRWGRRCAIRLPGGSELWLYQPLHPVAYDLPAQRRACGESASRPKHYSDSPASSRASSGSERVKRSPVSKKPG